MTYNSMTGEEFDVRDHAKKVDLLLDDYRQYKNERVPISFACDEALWLKIAKFTVFSTSRRYSHLNFA